MSTFMQHFREFWAAWSPWICVLLIPTIISGLSMSPKTQKAGITVGKVWDYIKHALSILSVATFKDQPGTFQLPMKLGSVMKKKKSGATGGTAVLVLIIALGNHGCSWWHSNTAKNIRKDAIDCAMESAKSNATDLLPAVLSILTGRAVNWKKQLEAFTKGFGVDATACALQMASVELQKSIAPTGSEATPESEKAAEGLGKASSYVDEQGWTYK